MNERTTYQIHEDEVAWCDLHDHNELVIGRLGLVKALTIGQPQYVDGYRVNKVAPIIEIDGRYVDPRLDHQQFWHVQLDIPDYPRPDAVTLLMSPNDAREIARSLLAIADDADRLMVKAARKHELRVSEVDELRMRQEVQAATRCSVEGCNRERHFFNDGRGYCKRHADELGIRPHGKAV